MGVVLSKAEASNTERREEKTKRSGTDGMREGSREEKREEGGDTSS